ncbi:MAG: hypothetical protein A3E07_01265 [Candidatus Wildermuthbacteria bacterium RIFCSPHIGHO2_12_FULL_45_9]|nr:MAG: hypothetical protein A3E07_01265 [Candidatus Wildermuthbacteria bacterium RIFCSPHIGHO2_12_FULL_45_9]
MLYKHPLLKRFLARANSYPKQKIIIETTGKSITTEDLAERSKTLAANLSQLGFEKGDRVLLLVRPGIDAITCILAVMWLGGVAVFADPGMGKDIFENRIKKANPKWVFAESIILLLQKIPFLKKYLRIKGYEIPEFSSLGNARIIRLGFGYPGLPHSIAYKSLFKKPTAKVDISRDLQGTDEAVIVFTSGTTQLPKGVAHTISSLSDTLHKIEELSAPTSQDRFYGALPHFLLLSISIGVTAIVSRKKFSAATFMKDIEQYRPTILFGPPAEFVEIIRYCQKNQKTMPTYVKKIFLGSAPVLSGFLRKLVGILPSDTQIKCIYGMTEILPVAVVDGREKILWQKEGDLVGKVIDGIHFTIASDGELMLKGPNLFRGYLDLPSQENIASGDLAKSIDGKLVLMGREKDMIIRGNYNIYPGLYEPIIQQIPGVAACALIGIRDEQAEDEAIILVVEPYNLEDKNVAEVVERSIRSGTYSIDIHALPDEISIMKLPRFGRQSKIDKKKLQELFKK